MRNSPPLLNQIDPETFASLMCSTGSTATQGLQYTTPSEDLVASCSLSPEREQKGNGPINNVRTQDRSLPFRRTTEDLSPPQKHLLRVLRSHI